MDVPPQDVITRDNVPARVNAVVYFRVVDPNKSVIEVENHVLATSQISQTTLRSVLGQKDLDDLLTNREADKRRAADHHRRADRPVGHQGQRRRGQGRRDPAADAAGDGPAGRERARAAGEDHRRRGRVPGLRAPQAGRRPAGEPDGVAAQALPDDGRDRRQPELHDHPAHPPRPLPALPGVPERRLRRGGQGGAARGGDEEAERLYEEAVGDVSPEAVAGPEAPDGSRSPARRSQRAVPSEKSLPNSK